MYRTLSCSSAATVVSGLSCSNHQRRHIQTGKHHTYEPGPIAKGIRSVFQTMTPSGLRKALAMKMQAKLERVQELEKQQQWLKTHGSPLAVMGLHEHAELDEVKRRYRDLLLDTHPDTVGGKRNKEGLVKVDDDHTDYVLLQTSYRMAMDPNSLWHMNNSAPALYNELKPRFMQKYVNQTTGFALMTYVIGMIVVCIVSFYGSKYALEQFVKFVDPDFWEFMLGQEAEEQRLRDMGIEPNTDPTRLAPKQMQKAWAPGRYVHDEDDEDYL